MLRRLGQSLNHCLLRVAAEDNSCRWFQKVRMSRHIQARRLEGVDDNIWVEFVNLAAKYMTVNLGQGFPDFSPPPFVKEAFVRTVNGDPMLNQYTRAFGHPALVKIIAKFYGKPLGQDLDPFSNVLVTVGAYEALFCAFQALVDEGDEVILIEPFFDCYDPMVKMAGGIAVFIPLRPKGNPLFSGNWQLDPSELEGKVTARTKAIVVNTPNNPLGKVFKREELKVISDLCVKHNLFCFSDEVYEWLVYDESKHVRIASLPGMWDRTITIGSAGKSFSATGWKVGWALGPDHLLKHLRTVHQNSVYHCATVAQEAVSYMFEQELALFGTPDSYFVQLPQELKQKRDRLAQCLTEVGMEPIIPEGSYYMMADISRFKASVPPSNDADEPYDYFFVKWMMKHKRLAAIPVSAFYSTPHKKTHEHLIRLCFAKDNKTLDAAEEILQHWSHQQPSDPNMH